MLNDINSPKNIIWNVMEIDYCFDSKKYVKIRGEF